ncbi:MAG: DsbA family protein [Gammaproteobacteria bacterium]|nr:DsbA family protein [Gammaproteobacteria bacterium]MDE0270383.1 DsbA family protein [Gammaproteobacteria bacterium]
MNISKVIGLTAAALLLLKAGGPQANPGPDGLEGMGHRVLELSAAKGVAPEIGLPPGRVVTVSFLDAEGTPWPAVEVVGPDADWLVHRPASQHAHVVFLESRGKRGSGNLVVLLDGLAIPVHLGLTTDASAAVAQVEVRLQDTRAATVSGRGSSPQSAAVADLDTAIGDYLLSHPEVLREALDPARQLTSQVEAHRDELLAAPEVPLLGDASGAVTVVEFFDYRCGFCKRSLNAVHAALAREGVRLQMREYPILGEDSARASRLALAAAHQGAYEEAHFALMAHEGEYDDASVERLASELGLDLERLRADMSSPKVDALIEANRELAVRLGVTGTPAFLVLGPERVLVSPGAVDVDRLNALIDSAG